tara:strand:+ start:137 stop:373 length:237 start_codon:yes stop_codon:yes gene_type:complete
MLILYSKINIYLNPANDQITIDCDNLANLDNWSIKIINMLGQEVFSQPINTQQYVIPLNSWISRGLYFVVFRKLYSQE